MAAYPSSHNLTVVLGVTTTEDVPVREHRSERFREMDMTISMIVFVFSILLNLAVLVYLKKKCRLRTSTQQLQFCTVLAMAVELVYRISTKVGLYTDWPSWTEKRILCYILFPFYDGFPYGIRTSIVLITIDAILRLRQPEPPEFGFSRKAVQASIWVTWIVSYTWGAIELFALGDGLTMEINDITGNKYCKIEPSSVHSSLASFILMTWAMLTAIILTSIALTVIIFRRKTQRGAFLILLGANIIQVCLDVPFLIVHTDQATDTVYNPDSDIWYNLYFLMKTSYLIVPLIWILPKDVGNRIRKMFNQFRSSTPEESPQDINLKSEGKAWTHTL